MKAKHRLILLFFVNTLFSQEFNVPYRKGNLWGFADKFGKIKIEPKYDSVNSQMDNFRWFVYKNGKTGIINTEGIERIPTKYDSIYRIPVHSQYNEFIIYKNNKCGYTDINGKIILPVEYKEIYKAEDESFNRLELKFFVLPENDTKYKLITENKIEVVSNIDDFENIYNGKYIIEINKKTGIYDLIKKSWGIQPEFDSIKYFKYKDFHSPKNEYKDIKYYGIKENKIFLITRNLQLIPTKSNNIEAFFEKRENDFDETNIDESKSSAYEKDIILVTGEKFVEGIEFKTYNFYRTRLKISITKEKSKYKIATNSLSFVPNKNLIFDEIKLFKIPYTSDEYDENIALVKSKKKKMVSIWYFKKRFAFSNIL